MQTGWMMGVMLAALVVAPAATVAAESRKPKEIVVVGSNRQQTWAPSRRHADASLATRARPRQRSKVQLELHAEIQP